MHFIENLEHKHLEYEYSRGPAREPYRLGDAWIYNSLVIFHAERRCGNARAGDLVWGGV
jgi:hypothetical protein